MTSTQVLKAYAVALLMLGAIAGWFAQVKAPHVQDQLFALNVFVNIAMLFWWFRVDAEERQYRRTRMLNVGVVALTAIVVPVYLYRSRPPGGRARAIGLFGLCLVGTVVISVIGGILGGLGHAFVGL